MSTTKGQGARILVITSCTGEKRTSHPSALTLEDFRRGPDHVAQREKDLEATMLPAGELYTGQHHVRLMRGVEAARAAGLAVDLWILSAGYGLVPAEQRLATYEATFTGMGKAELRRWADALHVPSHFRALVAGECPPAAYNLVLVLLGDNYLEACRVDATARACAPVVLLCSGTTARRITTPDGWHVIPLANPEARRFSCGLLALKGELGKRVLNALATGAVTVPTMLERGPESIGEVFTPHVVRAHQAVLPLQQPARRSTPDTVISLAPEWLAHSRGRRLRYFLPDCGDLVNPDWTPEQEGQDVGVGGWARDVYAHQLFPTPSCDGLLVSRMEAERTSEKLIRLEKLGVHRYLRVPDELPVMGDCGAFGYVDQDSPPFTTADLAGYYTRLRFTLGVSLDHIAVAAPSEQERRRRYELTLHLAEEFLREHKAGGHRWQAVGAVQGWNSANYAEAARQTVAMGYERIALGGLVRTPTAEVLAILEEVHKVVPEHVPIHLFGLGRVEATEAFLRLGVRTVDTASPLRKAWTDARHNYLTPRGETYAAIRVPQVEGRAAKALTPEQLGQARGLEAACLQGLVRFDRGEQPLVGLLDALEAYERMIFPGKKSRREFNRRTLEAAPWRTCPCVMCTRHGVHVLVFRGNDRNRRRGFHNVWAFNLQLERALAGVGPLPRMGAA